MRSDQSLPDTIQSLNSVLEPDAASILGVWAKGLLRLKKKGIAGLNDLFLSVEKIIMEEPNSEQVKKENRLLRKTLGEEIPMCLLIGPFRRKLNICIRGERSCI